MARSLKGFAFTRGPRGKSKYEGWLDGKTWALEPSDVAPTTLLSARAYLTVLARRRGKRIHTEFKDKDTLIVQAVAL